LIIILLALIVYFLFEAKWALAVSTTVILILWSFIKTMITGGSKIAEALLSLSAERREKVIELLVQQVAENEQKFGNSRLKRIRHKVL
jgi:hypothetical protein